MTQEQFARYSYRHSETIIYHQKHPEADVECMLLGVSFETEMFHLVPFDQGYYEDKSFWVPYRYCDKKAVMRVKINKNKNI